MVKHLFTSLFGKVFAAVTAVVLLYFAAVHFISVPLIRQTLEQAEEAAGLTILNTVVEIIQKTKTDLDSYRSATLEARKKQLRDVVTLMETYLRRQLERRLAAGEERSAALRAVFEELRRFHYGDQDYVFVTDYRSLTLSHPDPKVHGSDYSQARDLRGQLIVPPMVEIARRDGEGYYSYWFNRLGRDTPSEKLSFVRDLADLGLVLGTGLYLDDVEEAVAGRRDKAFAALREKLKTIQIAKGGYVFVFDDTLAMLIHPNSNLEGRSLGDKLDPVTGRPLAELLKESADRGEGLRYRWDRPDDPGRYEYDKIAWVRYFDGFGWYVATSVYLDDLHAGSEILAGRLRWIALAGLLVSLGLGYWYVRRLTAPMRALAATAQQVTGGDLTARCPVVRSDEIGILADAFNGMVGRLQESILTLDNKVRQRTDALERANAELRELDRLKTEFLSSISHELRTPLTAVVGFAKLVRRRLDRLADTGGEGEGLHKARLGMEALVAESERLAALINQVLDLSQLEAGKVVMQCQPLQCQALLADALAAVRARAEAKGLTLGLTVAALPEVRGDAVRLRQVVDNLLDNAVKFTRQGQIEVSAEVAGPYLEIGVSDSGIGIADGMRDKVFDKFHQVGESLADKPPGIGLGLPISRLIVEQHGGAIEVASIPGVGSRFTVRLPLG